MVVDRPVTWFIKQIGHPGAEEPYGVKGLKAGFHEQECIEVMQDMGFACTPIELVPTISPYTDGRSARPIFFGLGESDNWHRVMRHMEGHDGVFTGVYIPPAPKKQQGHAVAWDGRKKMVYDSNHGGQIYPVKAMYDHWFTPRCFWKIQRVT
ncbi:MAG: hypothetical protein AMS22_08465 [Thiotrichales bacterium SG8_50]|nr:MAG: hypothetical protein AMS22_08465 [Thiotrichales bacterium SG8_50]